jgi:hypothetical protein
MYVQRVTVTGKYGVMLQVVIVFIRIIKTKETWN